MIITETYKGKTLMAEYDFGNGVFDEQKAREHLKKELVYRVDEKPGRDAEFAKRKAAYTRFKEAREAAQKNLRYKLSPTQAALVDELNIESLVLSNEPINASMLGMLFKRPNAVAELVHDFRMRLDPDVMKELFEAEADILTASTKSLDREGTDE